MSEPRRDDPVIRFFGAAFIAIGWLVLTLGGLCTLIFGAMTLNAMGEFHSSLEDWTLPIGMLAFGGASIWIGRTIRRGHGPVPPSTAKTPDDTHG
jgi:hypothetical protein